MHGIEIAKQFYLEHGKKAIEENLPEYANRIAVGLAGEGSECLRYDDDISKDHDFDAGFCLWIPKEDEAEYGFKLERIYAKLPKEFMGLKRNTVSPAGGNRRGVLTIEEFYSRLLGATSAPDSTERWFYTPSYMLLSASNGEVWSDPLGEFSKTRNIISKGYPDDVRKKKIASHLAIMGQSGQYNYSRLVSRGETGAAQLAIFEFVKHAISVVYLINNRYEPFYKWAYRGMRDLPLLSDLELSLSAITELGNSKKEAQGKTEVIEDIATEILGELRNQGLSTATCNNFDTHAYSVTDKIVDPDIRNMDIMAGV